MIDLVSNDPEFVLQSLKITRLKAELQSDIGFDHQFLDHTDRLLTVFIDLSRWHWGIEAEIKEKQI